MKYIQRITTSPEGPVSIRYTVGVKITYKQSIFNINDLQVQIVADKAAPPQPNSPAYVEDPYLGKGTTIQLKMGETTGLTVINFSKFVLFCILRPTCTYTWAFHPSQFMPGC